MQVESLGSRNPKLLWGRGGGGGGWGGGVGFLCLGWMFAKILLPGRRELESRRKSKRSPLGVANKSRCTRKWRNVSQKLKGKEGNSNFFALLQRQANYIRIHR